MILTVGQDVTDHLSDRGGPLDPGDDEEEEEAMELHETNGVCDECSKRGEKKMVLIVDDDPERHESIAALYPAATITHTYSAADAMTMLGCWRYDVVQLDYDLGLLRDGTVAANGMVVASYIASLPSDRRPDLVVLHTWSPLGVILMDKAISKAGIHVLIRLA